MTWLGVLVSPPCSVTSKTVVLCGLTVLGLLSTACISTALLVFLATSSTLYRGARDQDSQLIIGLANNLGLTYRWVVG